ncbi:DNA polymerase IV [Sphingomicrobium arenosum]|uniref:DNA polymerase IV n=1 Tax=Sphingomicrobium arenosum TaxID=2233861 RepID=UPI002240FB58|nr:DNA polymerase IV [Sphingomicrobium arenosum]
MNPDSLSGPGDLPAPGADGRKIIHVDMDAFFASVEQRDHPELKGKPVAVGGGHRGVVAAASYEARVFGVRSAMPSVTAKRKCPDLIFVKSRFDVYRAVSQQIRDIFAIHASAVQPLSLDEAFLDVTEDPHGLGSGKAIAEDIRARIKAETDLTASAGVSYCKFIAKLASDQNKPDGLCVIPPSKGPAFVQSLPVKRFHGVGPKTAEKMNRLGIMTGADLAAWPYRELKARFGSSADWYYRIARGIDERPVRSNRTRKSCSAERTFNEDVREEAETYAELDRVSQIAWERIEKARFKGRTVNLKVKYSDFEIITRARSFTAPVTDADTFHAAGRALLSPLFPLEKGVRLLGLGLSSPVEEEVRGPTQLGLAFE